MSRPFPQPDALALREALRGLRYLLRRGGETLAETLPGPAGAALREVEPIAQAASDLASDVARSVLGAQDAPPETLGHLTEAQFGAAI